MRRHILVAALWLVELVVGPLIPIEASAPIVLVLLALSGYLYRNELSRILRRMFGRHRTLVDDEEVASRNPGNGRVAAKRIRRAPNTEHARSIFDGFRAAPRRVDEAYPYASMVVRLNSDLPERFAGGGGFREYELARKEIDSLTREGQKLLNFQLVLEGMKRGQLEGGDND